MKPATAQRDVLLTSRYSDNGIQKKRVGCYKCPAGKFSHEDGKTCTTCPVGRYQECYGSKYCKKCPSGKLAMKPGEGKCKLVAGALSRGMRSPCPVGKFRTGLDDVGADGKVACGLCPPGKFSNFETVLHFEGKCESCPVHTFQPGYSASYCLPCSTGKKALGQTKCVKAGKASDVPVAGDASAAALAISTQVQAVGDDSGCPVGKYKLSQAQADEVQSLTQAATLASDKKRCGSCANFSAPL